MSWWRHGVAAFSFAVITLNLLLWLAPLFLLLAVKMLGGANGRSLTSKPMAAVYRGAVRVDDWWLRDMLGVRWPRPKLPLARERSYVVLANHLSWMDIFIIQSVFARTGLIVKFLTKRELAWMPVLGLIFLAFDFPLLRRRARTGMDEKARSRDDRRRVRQACAVLTDAPGAMLTFAEGTRFTAEKQQRNESPYRHLLRPKLGGVSAVCDAVGGPVIDLTLCYPGAGSFWRMLAGGAPAPLVHVELADVPETADLRDWLNERWRAKDERLDEWVRERRAT